MSCVNMAVYFYLRVELRTLFADRGTTRMRNNFPSHLCTSFYNIISFCRGRNRNNFSDIRKGSLHLPLVAHPSGRIHLQKFILTQTVRLGAISVQIGKREEHVLSYDTVILPKPNVIIRHLSENALLFCGLSECFGRNCFGVHLPSLGTIFRLFQQVV